MQKATIKSTFKNYLDSKFTEYDVRYAYNFTKVVYQEILKEAEKDNWYVFFAKDKKYYYRAEVPCNALILGGVFNFQLDTGEKFQLEVHLIDDNVARKGFRAMLAYPPRKGDPYYFVLPITEKQFFDWKEDGTGQEIIKFLKKNETMFIHELIHLSRHGHDKMDSIIEGDEVVNLHDYYNSKEEIYTFATTYAHDIMRYKGELPQRLKNMYKNAFSRYKYFSKKKFKATVNKILKSEGSKYRV